VLLPNRKVIMYHEQIDKVSEDLLREVNDKDEVKEVSTTQATKKRKDNNKVVKANKKKDKLKDGTSIVWSLEFRPQLKGINDEEFPDLLGAKSQPQQQVFDPYKPLETPEVKPEQEEKKGEDYSGLEDTIKKNQELHKRHKIDPNRLKQDRKKKRNNNKLKVKKEEFPGLPGS